MSKCFIEIEHDDKNFALGFEYTTKEDFLERIARLTAVVYNTINKRRLYGKSKDE